MKTASLHHGIISFFLEHQRAPLIRELAEALQCDEVQTRIALRRLAHDHGVVLHPQSEEIWVVHPFSAAPTPCVVRADSKAWWGNCVWCSLGLAQLAGGSATIETRVGGMEESARVRIQDGTLLDTDFVVHFPIPMHRAWENVIYTCSVMLLFRSEKQVHQWCATRGIAKGDVRPIEQVWAFASEWYARYADVDWRKWTANEATEMFQRHGLTGPVWSLPGGSDRF